ncbi:hypothetical protein RJ639_025630 [Escallonia herrerae]|uniref:Uncharacterized protein n=1 Tax=Escallonia herrerae TaxID=1293975 RepID=A0AA89ABC9_9ASTE|nr:hypothetical protein RJ639_025630 [Escallonia herrerae]
MDDKCLHVAMYPWFGMGHLTPYLCLANKLAAAVTVPHVEGLPLGTETTANVPHPMHSHLMTAMDLTLPFIEATLRKIKPHCLVRFPSLVAISGTPSGHQMHPLLRLKTGSSSVYRLPFLEKAFGRPLILTGPVLPEPPTTVLEEGWASWLEGFKRKTVIYYSLGSEIVLEKDQFQELVLGLELTGLPFWRP